MIQYNSVHCKFILVGTFVNRRGKKKNTKSMKPILFPQEKANDIEEPQKLVSTFESQSE